MIVFLGRVKHLLVLYSAAMLLGLLLGVILLLSGETYVEEQPAAGFSLFFYILIATAAILALTRFPKLLRALLFALELLFLFVASLTFSLLVLPSYSAVFFSLWVTWSRLTFRRSLLMRNISTLLISAWIMAFLGVYLHPLPILIFLTVMAVYDFISVFVTKHMLVLAEKAAGLKPGGELLGLGGGDVVLPGALVVSLLHVSEYVSIAALIGAIVGLIFTLRIVRRRGRPLPALPSILFPQLLLVLLTLVVFQYL